MLSRKPSAGGRDILYVALAEAIGEGGCPVCRCMEKAERNFLWTLLYEHANDPHVRGKIIEGNGFCGYHFRRLIEIAGSDPLIGGLAPALIVENLLLKYVESAEADARLETSCYACSELAKIEESYASSFASRLATTDLLNLYESNPKSLLCYRHYLEVRSRAPREAARRLKEVQLEKMKRLLDELRSYIAKHDYRFAGTITESEASSWVRAVEAMKGSGWASYRFSCAESAKRAARKPSRPR